MKQKNFWFFLAFAAVILAFFWDLAVLKQAFLSGDHREQQYPWAKFYQEQIRQGMLPWWTTDIQSGFPILAEGQIGAFYPLNFLFFFFLPVKIAYNYIILFQYWLGAVFMFLYLRRRNLSQAASFFGSLAFLFGSTQGGYFYYNYISQKTVIWLPLTLILVDRLENNRKWQDAFWLAAVFAVQIFAGYLQVAIYSVFFTSLYFLWRWAAARSSRFICLFALAGGLGIFFSLAQLLPTYELSLLSSRANAAKGLAYVGSMTPAGFLTLFYPAWDSFVGSEMYLGVISLFFVLGAALGKKTPHEKFFLSMFALFCLLALGQYSPLYRALVEGTGFNSFRTPIKFLFFATFSLCVLAAYGFDRFFYHFRSFPEKAARFFYASAAVMIAFPLAATAFLGKQRETLLPKFQDFVVTQFFGKPGHPYPVEHYREKAAALYDNFRQAMDLSVQHTRIEFFMILLAAVLVFFLLRFHANRKAAMQIALLFLTLDLYAYGFTSIKPNQEPFYTIDSPAAEGALVKTLKSDPDLFRIMEVYQKPEENRIFPVFPCWNMLDGIQDLGAYSPLVMKSYTGFLEGWGYVNDSLSVHWVQPQKVLEKLPLINAMNVKYLLSTTPLEHESLSKIQEDSGVLLYRNQNARPRAFFIPGVTELASLDAPEVTQSAPVEIRDYRQNHLALDFTAPAAGLLVVTDIHYAGWEAFVNGSKAPLLKTAGLFRGIILRAGENRVVMRYHPALYQNLGKSAALVFILGALLALKQRKAGKS